MKRVQWGHQEWLLTAIGAALVWVLYCAHA